MTFTFDPSLADEISLVRFHIGDNHTEGHFIEDETIQYYITNYGWKKAVIAGIGYIITQLARPDFVEDWLEVNHEKARLGYEGILKLKKQELGVGSAVAMATVSLPSRADSLQVNNDYSEVEYEE